MLVFETKKSKVRPISISEILSYMQVILGADEKWGVKEFFSNYPGILFVWIFSGKVTAES